LDNMVPIATPKSGAGIDLDAQRLIARIQPEALKKPSSFDIESFFDLDFKRLTGIDPDYRYLPPGIHGFTDSDKKECVISASLMESDNKNNIYFVRSTMAHEVSHAIIHIPEFRQKKALLRSIHDDDHASLKMYRQSDIPIYQNPEWQAWRHAGALLMPAIPFKKLITEGASVREMANVFGVNPAFIQTRARALKIILN